MIPNKIKVWRDWWKKKKSLAVLLRPNTPKPVSAFTVKSCTQAFFSHSTLSFKWKYKPYLNVIDHTDMNLLSRYLCTAIYNITRSVVLWCYSDVMYNKTVRSIRAVLTRDDLKHAVLLHVCREVPSSHVLLHYTNIGQLLMAENTVHHVIIFHQCRSAQCWW